MANLPRFGRAWQRITAGAGPAPAAAQPASEPESEILPLAPITQTLQLETNPTPGSPPRISSPVKKQPSPAALPKHNSTIIRLTSSPGSPSRQSFDRKHSISPNSHQKSVKPTTFPLSPLALPKSANVNTIKSIIQPEVERITDRFKKPAKPERRTEYGSGKPPQKAEAINLSGHNVGAIMEVKQSSDQISGGEVIKKIESETDDGKTGAKEKSNRASGFPMTQFMNSNFQEVNNSVMFNSSCSGRDPGLHLDFSGKTKDDGAIVDGGEKSKY